MTFTLEWHRRQTASNQAKPLRKSTNFKRVELEKRQEHCSYLKGIASLRNTGKNDLLDESYKIESIPERFLCIFVSFAHILTYNEALSKLNSSNRYYCCLYSITGMPAQYFDPLIQMPYATLEAFKILR
ncbi:unnamed protein product [Rotaria sp. Silwood2]|nr:unnamed protein product [Rotaria sp. Silwood2]CAF4029291.1 unnamed protein product [Rotaria sp. Silwood2]